MVDQRPFPDHALAAELIPLRRYARSLTRDRDGADDLVQAGVLRALSRAELFQPGTNLRAWLFTIMRNEFISSMRTARSRGVHVSVDDVGHRLPVAPSQEACVELNELRGAVMELPCEERWLLGAVVYEGHSYADAAAKLNVAVGTVKSRVARTRARLRQ